MNKNSINKLLVLTFIVGLVGCSQTNDSFEITSYSSFFEEQKEGVLLKPDLRAPSGEVLTEICGHNLSLESSVDIVYYVKNSAQEFKDKGLLLWKSVPSSYTFDNAEYKLHSTTQEIISEVTYDAYYFSGVSAKEMMNYVYAVSYVYDGTDYTYSQPDKYSIYNYCANKKSSTTTLPNGNKTLGEMVEAILNYGAFTQEYFGYNLDRLPTNTYYTLTLNDAHLDDGFSFGDYKSSDVITITANDPELSYQVFSHWEVKYDIVPIIYDNKEGVINVSIDKNTVFTALYKNKDLKVSVTYYLDEEEQRSQDFTVAYQYSYTLTSSKPRIDGVRFNNYTVDGEVFPESGKYPFMNDCEVSCVGEYIKLTFRLDTVKDVPISQSTYDIYIYDLSRDLRLPVPDFYSPEPKDEFSGWYYGDTKITDNRGALMSDHLGLFDGKCNQDDFFIDLVAHYGY